MVYFNPSSPFSREKRKECEIRIVLQSSVTRSCFLELRTEEVDIPLPGNAEGAIKLNDDKGVLALGKLSQKYIDDQDLRGILANAELDANKMKSFAESDKLLLIIPLLFTAKNLN